MQRVALVEGCSKHQHRRGARWVAVLAASALAAVSLDLTMPVVAPRAGAAAPEGLLEAPDNDAFAAARWFDVNGSSPLYGDNIDATKEAGEPLHAGFSGEHSAWWVFTAPTTGELALSTEGSGSDTLLAVYTGSSVNALSSVASNNNYSGNAWSLLTFVATAGTTYHIAIDTWEYGTQPEPGGIILNFLWSPPPANDNFAAATPFGMAGGGPLFGSNAGASKEPSEPSHAFYTGGRSVWWVFTAPSNGRMTLSTEGSNFDTLLAVYTGNAVGALTSVAYNHNYSGNTWSLVTFNATAGITYHVAVDGYGYPATFGSITLGFQWLPNDAFASATPFSLGDPPLTGSNVGASKEPGEANHAGDPGGRSVWWVFTALANGTASISTQGSNFDTVLAVYTGGVVSGLSQVAANGNVGGGDVWSLVTFSVTAGVTYHVAVDGAGGAAGTVMLSSAWAPAPPMLEPLTPARVIDSRLGIGVELRPLNAREIVTFSIVGKGGVPPSGVAAVSLNVTAVNAADWGYVTVYPCGTMPVASNLNYVAGQTVPNAVIAPLSADGSVCFYTWSAIDLIVDVSAWFPTGSDLHALTPARLLDTRTGEGTSSRTESEAVEPTPVPPATDYTENNPSVAAPEAAVIDRYIVRFAAGVAASDQVTGMQSQGIDVLRVYEDVFQGALVHASPAAIAALRADPNVMAVEPDKVLQFEPGGVEALDATTDTLDATQNNPTWGIDRTDQRKLPLSNSYTYPSTGAGVTAYIIDSGIRADHVDFSGRVLAGYTAINDGRGTGDCYGHGTHVAGTVGGSTFGMAKGVSLVPVRIAACQSSFLTSDLISGINWVVSNHQAGAPAVANMSLGGAVSDAKEAAVAALINDGVTVVAAAGNEDGPACSSSPARMPAVITVAATDANDRRASFSNYGSCVDLFAPGVDIVSASYASTTGSTTKDGTSMAAPHVTGAVAIVLAQQPAWSPAQVSNYLVGNATVGVVGDDAGSPNRLLYASPDRLNVMLRAGDVLELKVAGRGGVPESGAAAVALNVTAVEALGWGFVTVYPCGPMPVASNVNYVAGQTVPNAVIAPLSPNGTVCFYTYASIHLIVDVSAWFPNGSELHPLSPARVVDSRTGVGVASRVLFAGETVQFHIAGQGGVPGSGVGAVALNVTAVDAFGWGYVTVFPCGPMPVASNVNYVAGQTVPNAVIAPLSPSGDVCFYTYAPIHLLVDVSAWFPD